MSSRCSKILDWLDLLVMQAILTHFHGYNLCSSVPFQMLLGSSVLDLYHVALVQGRQEMNGAGNVSPCFHTKCIQLGTHTWQRLQHYADKQLRFQALIPQDKWDRSSRDDVSHRRSYNLVAASIARLSLGPKVLSCGYTPKRQTERWWYEEESRLHTKY